MWYLPCMRRSCLAAGCGYSLSAHSLTHSLSLSLNQYINQSITHSLECLCLVEFKRACASYSGRQPVCGLFQISHAPEQHKIGSDHMPCTMLSPPLALAGRPTKCATRYTAPAMRKGLARGATMALGYAARGPHGHTGPHRLTQLSSIGASPRLQVEVLLPCAAGSVPHFFILAQSMYPSRCSRAPQALSR